MIMLQSGMSRPSSATDVAKMQLISPFLNLMIVCCCSRIVVFLPGPLSDRPAPVYAPGVS